MRFAFFGTPSFSTKVLDSLEGHGFLPALVITAPDKPQGRGLALTPPPVKAWALERDIDVVQPSTLKDEGIQAELRNTDWDVFVVAAYAKLLPQAVLDIPSHGCLNVHPSLLPKFRGPSPVVSAILADERQTGVTVMEMTAAMDAGPIVAQARIEIAEEDWPPPSSALTDLLFTEGGTLLAETLPLWTQRKVEAVAQDDTRATYTKKFAPEDALLEPIEIKDGQLIFADPRGAFLKIRAFDTGPRAHFLAERDGKRLRAVVVEASWDNGSVWIKKVIPEGKKVMDFREFIRSGEKIIDNKTEG